MRARDGGPIEQAEARPKPLGGNARATFGNLALKLVLDDSAEAYACPIRFQGQWQDEETGLYYNRHRHYDPLAGQYLSPDPIGLPGGDRPQSYVENPILWIDALGLRQGRRSDGTFLSPYDDPSLPAPGKAFENTTAAGFRAKGDTVYQNITIRDGDGKVLSYGDAIVVRDGKPRFITEQKSGRRGLNPGQRAVQAAVRNGDPLIFDGPNAAGMPDIGDKIIMPKDAYKVIGPGDQLP